MTDGATDASRDDVCPAYSGSKHPGKCHYTGEACKQEFYALPCDIFTRECLQKGERAAVSEISGFKQQLLWVVDDIDDGHISLLFHLRDRLQHLLDKVKAEMATCEFLKGGGGAVLLGDKMGREAEIPYSPKGERPESCPKCGGSGQVDKPLHEVFVGIGVSNKKQCPACGGTGKKGG